MIFVILTYAVPSLSNILPAQVLSSVELLGTSGLTGCAGTPTVEASCTAIFSTYIIPALSNNNITGQMLIDYLTTGTTGDNGIDTNWNSSNGLSAAAGAFNWDGSQWIATGTNDEKLTLIIIFYPNAQ